GADDHHFPLQTCHAAATFREPSTPIVVMPAACPRESQGRWSDNSDLANLARSRIGAPLPSAVRSRGMTTDSKTVAFASFMLWTHKQINGLARSGRRTNGLCDNRLRPFLFHIC